jgi:uncharacterized protein YPO0396
MLQQVELPKYKEKIRQARDAAMEQFQNDFLSKLKSNIDSVTTQVQDLNKALRESRFGRDKYQFKVAKNPDYEDYYEMIMDPELMENNEGLFAYSFQQKHSATIDSLFNQIVMVDDNDESGRRQKELFDNVELFTDYRTYLVFDLETVDDTGNTELLSKVMKKKSGGETQTPFYIAILASFAQIYRVRDVTGLGNTMRLIIFDEAFNKMDSDRIVESIRLFREFGLQAVFSTPPDKIQDIMPEADRTFWAENDNNYMRLFPWQNRSNAQDIKGNGQQ